MLWIRIPSYQPLLDMDQQSGERSKSEKKSMINILDKLFATVKQKAERKCFAYLVTCKTGGQQSSELLTSWTPMGQKKKKKKRQVPNQSNS